MELYLYIFISVFIVSLISLIGVVAFSFSNTTLKLLIPILVSIAAGAMLGGAFIHLVPSAFLFTDSPLLTSLLIIAGMLLFFILEKFLHWHHSHACHDVDEYSKCKHKDIDMEIHTIGHMVLVSDAFHNFIDGMIIATSFLISVPVGIATSMAVLLHEIPQELGDFGVLLHAGYSKKRALFVNFLSAILAFFGAGTALSFVQSANQMIYLIVPIAAGAFIYIATADLIPTLHKTVGVRNSLLQLSALIAGVAIMALLVFLE